MTYTLLIAIIELLEMVTRRNVNNSAFNASTRAAIDALTDLKKYY